MLTIGILSNNYLQNYFYKDAKNKLHEAFFNLSLQLKSTEKDLLESLHFVSEDEMIIASLNLIKNYEDINNYNNALFDEEKKRIIEILLREGKYSFNNYIAIYNATCHLVAYINKKDEKYYIGYVSYKDAKPLYYSKALGDAYYHISSKPEHINVDLQISAHVSPYEIQHGGVVYEEVNDELNLRSNRAILRKISETQNDLIGFIETNRVLSRNDVDKLVEKEELFLSYTFNHNKLTITHLDHGHYIKMHEYDNAPLLFSQYDASKLFLGNNEHLLFSGVRIALENGFLLLTAHINKKELQTSLIQSRQMLIASILFIAIATLVISFIVLNRMLSLPLKSLLKGIEVISKGDYSHHIKLNTNDEFGLISLQFNEMARKIEKRERELDELAHRDALTQMPNRVMFQKRSDAAINRAKRLNSKLAIFFLDLDEFKIINDTLGHDVGDKLLIEVSRSLSKIMRENDLLARIGGDEFNILIEDLESPIFAQNIAQKIIEQMKQPILVNGEQMNITSSIGIAIYPDDGQDSVTLLKNADLAMYHAKASGRDRYRFFSKELGTSLKQRIIMLKELKMALSREEFKLFYQPKFSLKDGSIFAAEALIRWDSKTLGFVMPDQFIPLAEESGEIIKVGAWVIAQACRDFAQWEKLELGITQVSVNVSNIQFTQGDIIKTLRESIEDAEISPESLEVEMTESYIYEDSENALKVLHQIRELGIGLAIDDFGTGYSSMSYLKRLPLNRLKIDKSFIDNIPHDSDDVEITKIIVALAKVMELAITAEGIETQEQMRFLQELECDEGQGYFCSKPLPCAQFIALLQSDFSVS